jgi:hypothetical protein
VRNLVRAGIPERVPIKGGIGVAMLIAVLLTAMLIELPQLRWPVIGIATAGIVLGSGLIMWRRRAGPRSL